jgi:hypothetical protein
VAAQHEHGFTTLLVELFEEEQRLFFEAETALLVAVDDVERVLPPVVVDIVAFESLGEIVLVTSLWVVELQCWTGLFVRCSEEGIRYSQLVTPLRKGR